MISDLKEDTEENKARMAALLSAINTFIAPSAITLSDGFPSRVYD